MDKAFFPQEQYMRRAIELARGGEGRTNPNPLVGAVIVKDGRVIGEGWHKAYGGLHAEREALKNCAERGENPKDTTIYVTLEPCCHFGKQPPCTEAILAAGIRCVVVGSRDPNLLVHGKGNAFLREHGIVVEEDFLRSECDALNPIFFHYITTNLPFVALKYAMTLDGKIATKTGESKWISNEQSRKFGHTLRNRYAAILAGIGTVLADDPLLNCRLVDENGVPIGRNPVRVICDSDLRIPLESQIVRTAKEIKTIVAFAEGTRDSESAKYIEEKRKSLEKAGVEVIGVGVLEKSIGSEALTLAGDSRSLGSSAEGERNPKLQVNLRELVKILGEKKIDGVFVEGGAEIHYSALQAGIVQKIYAFVAPKIFGGTAKSPVAGEGVSLPSEAFQFRLEKVTRFGEDVLLEYRNADVTDKTDKKSVASV